MRCKKVLFWVLLLCALGVVSPTTAQTVPVTKVDCLGNEGCDHDKLHNHYQKVFRNFETKQAGLGDEGHDKETLLPHYNNFFATWKCNCSTGQCRPTKFRTVARGLEAWIDQKWVWVPPESLRKPDLKLLPAELLAYEGHACAVPNPGQPEPFIECAWRNVMS